MVIQYVCETFIIYSCWFPLSHSRKRFYSLMYRYPFGQDIWRICICYLSGYDNCPVIVMKGILISINYYSCPRVMNIGICINVLCFFILHIYIAIAKKDPISRMVTFETSHPVLSVKWYDALSQYHDFEEIISVPHSCGRHRGRSLGKHTVGKN